MKVIITIGIILLAALQLLAFWGAGKCNDAGGKWVSMGYGKHCVDSELNDIKYLH